MNKVSSKDDTLKLRYEKGELYYISGNPISDFWDISERKKDPDVHHGDYYEKIKD